jgi:hypothetical protein
VYDLLGNEVKVLVNEEKLPGKHTIEFDASKLASGIYFYHFVTQDFIKTKKILLIN